MISTNTIEDFPDFFSNDPDFVPERADSSSSPETAENISDFAEDRQDTKTTAPSDNPRNVHADSTRRSPSPILTHSLDQLADDHGLFDDSLGSISPFDTPTPGVASVPRSISSRPNPQYRLLRPPAGFSAKPLPDYDNLSCVVNNFSYSELLYFFQSIFTVSKAIFTVQTVNINSKFIVSNSKFTVSNSK